MTTDRPRLAFWFRYGPAEHAELFHAIPEIVAALDREVEVHYFGFRSSKPIPEAIRAHAVIHNLPWRVDRQNQGDKWRKSLLWILLLPWLGLWCRALRIRAVYLDETVPLSAGLARIFFGRRVAFSVVDFFTDIYLGGSSLTRVVARAVKALDLAVWRRLPLIFTRAQATRTFLAAHGVRADRVHAVYDPCDFDLFHPVDRAAARQRYGFGPADIVLVHHGILHPNKGNDRILQALAAQRAELPAVRYLLIGDGPDMARLRELARTLAIEDRVVFTGWLPQCEDVNQALNACDIGLVMRVGHESDNFHMTGALIHAMAVGLPILAARLGGVSEVVREGDAGLLFDPSDMAEFGAKLRQLSADPALRARCGARALALARDLFAMDRVTQATVAPLLDLVRS